MEGHLGNLHWVLDVSTFVFAYQETDHLLWSYHLGPLSLAWTRTCLCQPRQTKLADILIDLAVAGVILLLLAR